MTDAEFSTFMINDLLKDVAHSVGIYAVALIAYWI